MARPLVAGVLTLDQVEALHSTHSRYPLDPPSPTSGRSLGASRGRMGAQWGRPAATGPGAWASTMPPLRLRWCGWDTDAVVAQHTLGLASAYALCMGEEPPITTTTVTGPTCVDYIWVSPSLEVVSVQAPLSRSQALRYPGGLPTKSWASDHIALVARLQWSSLKGHDERRDAASSVDSDRDAAADTDMPDRERGLGEEAQMHGERCDGCARVVPSANMALHGVRCTGVLAPGVGVWHRNAQGRLYDVVVVSEDRGWVDVRRRDGSIDHVLRGDIVVSLPRGALDVPLSALPHDTDDSNSLDSDSSGVSGFER
mmetsp:Transcript_29452/g.63590  ORF Transcript_29452/g.63590 Transcript_29452/m.63590 type:complete len:313 (+) Transcript_29452:846-1784(+)